MSASPTCFCCARHAAFLAAAFACETLDALVEQLVDRQASARLADYYRARLPGSETDQAEHTYRRRIAERRERKRRTGRLLHQPESRVTFSHYLP